MRRGRWIGLALTLGVVAVLLGSLIAGIAGVGGAGEGTQVDEVERPAAPSVRVEVLNAAGVPGLARAATERLRERGFDVVYYGNARGFGPDTSLVLDRSGNEEAAEAVGEALDIERVRSEPDTSLYLEVTVVLGKDWGGAAEEPAGR